MGSAPRLFSAPPPILDERHQRSDDGRNACESAEVWNSCVEDLVDGGMNSLFLAAGYGEQDKKHHGNSEEDQCWPQEQEFPNKSAGRHCFLGWSRQGHCWAPSIPDYLSAMIEPAEDWGQRLVKTGAEQELALLLYQRNDEFGPSIRSTVRAGRLAGSNRPKPVQHHRFCRIQVLCGGGAIDGDLDLCLVRLAWPDVLHGPCSTIQICPLERKPPRPEIVA
jgi:hypothetical protein